MDFTDFHDIFKEGDNHLQIRGFISVLSEVILSVDTCKNNVNLNFYSMMFFRAIVFLFFVFFLGYAIWVFLREGRKHFSKFFPFTDTVFQKKNFFLITNITVDVVYSTLSSKQFPPEHWIFINQVKWLPSLLHLRNVELKVTDVLMWDTLIFKMLMCIVNPHKESMVHTL